LFFTPYIPSPKSNRWVLRSAVYIGVKNLFITPFDLDSKNTLKVKSKGITLT